MSVRKTLALALCTGLSLGDMALAQSFGAPAGEPAVTAPGGTEGIAGPGNERRAIESGDAIPAAPGIGVPVETPPPPPSEEPRLPPPPPRP